MIALLMATSDAETVERRVRKCSKNSIILRASEVGDRLSLDRQKRSQTDYVR